MSIDNKFFYNIKPCENRECYIREILLEMELRSYYNKTENIEKYYKGNTILNSTTKSYVWSTCPLWGNI